MNRWGKQMDEATRDILISESDLLKCARMIEARFADPVQEASRVEITRRFLTSALAVEQALRVHSRCALVNHCGTHGNSNLAEATEGLVKALRTYTALVNEIAARSWEMGAAADGARPAQPTARPKLEVA